MVYGIVRDHKLRNQNRNQLDNTTDTSSAPSAPSYRMTYIGKKYDINQNIHIFNCIVLKSFNKISWFKNKQQYIIPCLPWFMELSEITN